MLLTVLLQGGAIPRWPLANVYTGCMVGNHANLMLLDLAVKQGLTVLNFSVRKLDTHCYELKRVSACL